MYCIKCGVKLADTEKSCPLCGTEVYHPALKQPEAVSLYPQGRVPKLPTPSKAYNVVFVILFMIPMVICLLADLQPDKRLDWFGLAAGGLGITYIAIALPFWFHKPNPVIFALCNFVTATLYLLYINAYTDGRWFASFALPMTGGLCLITCTVVALLYYLRRGRLFIWGGAVIALGVQMLLVEYLLSRTFGLSYVGWSVYPCAVLVIMGALLIYLAANRSAREFLARKLFF